jgi:hypothetical protein
VHRLLLVTLLVTGCHAKSQDGLDPDPPDAASDPVTGTGVCNAIVTHETPLLAASHVAQDSEVRWSSNPPSSGPHYPTLETWAIAYPIVIPRGNYLHNEEHGGITLLYNCPDGCPELVAGLKTIGETLPHDPICPDTMNARWIVTRDPLLPPGIQVAASAWGWTYKADCLDEATLSDFITARYAQGGSDRDNCTDGVP